MRLELIIIAINHSFLKYSYWNRSYTNELFIPFFDFRFSLVLADEVTKIPEYYVICLFTFFKCLACLALQTETIVKKITQPKLPKMKKELPKYVMSRA